MALNEKIKEMQEKLKKQGFEAWMSQPTTRLIISMIPAGDHKEALDTLLRDAYDYGFGSGGAALGIELMSSVMDKKNNPPV